MLKKQSSVATHERRRDERSSASGKVSIHRCAPSSLDLVGELMDNSRGGFRASYSGGTLASGDEVYFEAPDRNGTAVVVWSRLQGGERQSGFWILALNSPSKLTSQL
jgi:hypothetical protein